MVSIIEVTVGIVAVSIPTYRPVYRAILGRGRCDKSSDGYNHSRDRMSMNIRGYNNVVQKNVKERQRLSIWWLFWAQLAARH